MNMTTALLTMMVTAALPVTATAAKNIVLTDTENNIEISDWSVENRSLGMSGAPEFMVSKKTLHGGKQEGSTLVTVQTDNLKVTLIPTRGMDIYEIVSGDVRLGWNSPVDEIVHPAYMNLDMRGGLGWLDGFNEMMVRCGFEWTGHPGEENGRLMSLHGRAGNTPASKVMVSIDETAPYAIHVKGLIKENTFKFSNLETWTTLTVVPGETTVKVHDELTNLSDYDRDYQIIYHSNFGAPILEQGAKVEVAVKEISPFNDYAVNGLQDWQTYLGPTKNFDEMVFNLVPYADDQGMTTVLLHNRKGDQGVAVKYDTRQLPVLTLWKNTDTVKQGYVTGIEPGTSYAYPRQIEREQGRVKTLAGGAMQSFDLEYHVLTSSSSVKRVRQEIKKIQGKKEITLISQPMAVE
ncbi:aldose 1-epimerase family protein [Gynuella sp.]|uniref:aldose 1-epimerase family protein n=1 Tax=Gynuella sp. TaxID=2969146 RepID=UPI003D0D7D64